MTVFWHHMGRYLPQPKQSSNLPSLQDPIDRNWTDRNGWSIFWRWTLLISVKLGANARRNPTPNCPANEFYEQFMSRVRHLAWTSFLARWQWRLDGPNLRLHRWLCHDCIIRNPTNNHTREHGYLLFFTSIAIKCTTDGNIINSTIYFSQKQF